MFCGAEGRRPVANAISLLNGPGMPFLLFTRTLNCHVVPAGVSGYVSTRKAGRSAT